MAEVGMLKGITDVRIADIPIGGVAVGLLASGFVDGLMGMAEGAIGKKLPVWAVKGLGAYAANRWLPRYIGADGARFATAILAVDAVQSLYDFRALTSGLFKRVGVAGAGITEAVIIGQGGRIPEWRIPEVTRPPELVETGVFGGFGEVGREKEEEIIVSFT